MCKEIALLHTSVPLSMFCLNAGKLNNDLFGRAVDLKDMMVKFQMEENRDLNEG